MFNTVQNLVDEKATKKELLGKVSEKFGISTTEVHKRIRSMFGMSVDDLLTPTKQELTRAILQADDIGELKRILKKDKGLGALYDKYYGVSTFASARKVCETYREVTPYNPTKADNLSILISQVVGDGHLEFKHGTPRNSIRIQHCEKQYDYLVEKVKLLNKAYPTTPAIGQIRKYRHAQGHVYYSYSTNRMNNSDMDYLYSKKACELVKEITPLGMYLVYMDDGSLCQSDNCTVLKISNGDVSVLESIRDYLKTFAISSNVYAKDMVVCMSDIVNISKFLNNFVKPFEKYTPECMKYKAELKI